MLSTHITKYEVHHSTFYPFFKSIYIFAYQYPNQDKNSFMILQSKVHGELLVSSTCKINYLKNVKLWITLAYWIHFPAMPDIKQDNKLEQHQYSKVQITCMRCTTSIAIRSADAYPLTSPWDMKHSVVHPLSLLLIAHCNCAS